MTRRTPARADLETPHRREYIASNDARMKEGVMPERLPGLLRWFFWAWWSETPDTSGHPGSMHVSGLWRSDGKGNRGIPTEEGYAGPPLERFRYPGGSALGTPQTSDPFRRYLEESPLAVDQDGYYPRPLASALHRLAFGEGRKAGKPLLARWLHLIARSDFDVRRAADFRKMPYEEAAVLAEGALKMLWPLYQERPSRQREAA